MKAKSTKALCTFLVFALVLGVMCPFSVLAQSPDGGFADRCSLLRDIGILKFDITGETDTVSKAQFIDMAVRTFIKELPSVEMTETFTDVIPNYEYRDAIDAAAKHGIVRGDGTGAFGINDPLTPSQAVTIFLRILGYEEYVGWQGGFESNFLTVASKIGLTKNVDLTEQSVTFANAVQLVCNAIEIAPLNLSSVKDGSASYEKDKNNILIYDKLDIFEEDGILTDNAYASLNGGSPLDTDYVKIGGALYKAGATDAADYIGMEVKVYARYEYDDKIPTVLHIEDYGTKMTVVDDEDFSGFKNGTLSYIGANGSRRTLKISKNAPVLYNGALVRNGGYDESLFDIDNGSITVIENSVDGLDVVLIKQYSDLIFDRVVENKDFSVIIDKFDSANNVRMDDADLFDIRDEQGNALSASEIESGSTVSAAVALDGKSGQLIVSGKNLTQAYVTLCGDSTVTVKTYNESIHTYDETEYSYTDKFKAKNKADGIVTPGSEYTVYVNRKGLVSHMEKETDMSDFYAYIIADASERCAFDNGLKLKVFKDDGKIGEYRVADDVKIDGVRCKGKSASEIRALLGLDSAERSRLVYMSLSYDSEVSSVDTCLDETAEREADYSLYKVGREGEDTLYKIDGGKPMYTTTTPNRKYYASETKSFDTGIFIGTNTKIMAIPRDSTDEGRFKILTTASFINNKYYMVKAYGRDDDSIAADVILYYYFSRYSGNRDEAEENGTTQFARTPFYTTTDTDAAFVSKMTKGTNPANGESCDILYLTILRSGAEVVHYIDDSSLTDGIEKGDIVRWYTIGGTLCYLEKLYDVENKTFNPNPRPMKWQNGSVVVPSYYLMHNGTFLADSFSTAESETPVFSITHGVIANKNSSHLSYLTYDDYANGNVAQKYLKTGMCTVTKVYRYDSKNNLLDKTDFKNLISCDDSELENSEAVIITKSMNVLAIIIY